MSTILGRGDLLGSTGAENHHRQPPYHELPQEFVRVVDGQSRPCSPNSAVAGAANDIRAKAGNAPHPFLIVPRFDGVSVSVDGVLLHKSMTAGELLTLGARAIDAGVEALRNERIASLNYQDDRTLCSAEGKSPSTITSTITLSDEIESVRVGDGAAP